MKYKFHQIDNQPMMWYFSKAVGEKWWVTPYNQKIEPDQSLDWWRNSDAAQACSNNKNNKNINAKFPKQRRKHMIQLELKHTSVMVSEGPKPVSLHATPATENVSTSKCDDESQR